MLIDTHAHLNFDTFKGDFDEIIERALKNDVWMINIGTNYETSKKAIEIAEGYKKGVYPHTNRGLRSAQKNKIRVLSGVGVYAAIGLHPMNLDTGLVKIQKSKPSTKGGKNQNDLEVPRPEVGDCGAGNLKFKNLEDILEESFNYEKYKNLAKSKKVVAIGEVGLDYYWRPKTTRKKELFKQKQKELLLEQLNLAKELNLPVVFHCRMAHQDLLEVLKSEIRNPKSETNPKSQIQNLKLRGVIHCFTGNWEQAKKFMDMGFYLGFNGIIFKLDLDEIIKKTPLNKILIETDCPYLSPPQFEDKRNEPLCVEYVARRIAEIKNVSFEEVAEKTTENAVKLFNFSKRS